MSESKLSTSEVPVKFAEWLLTMGCPPDKVPNKEKIVEMCRGHYMVWRSVMEHVEPKDVIKHKRLQVFSDDIRRWKRKNYKYQKDTESVIPDELSLWNQHHDVKEKVFNTENRVAELQKQLSQLTDKISMKLTHCNLSRERLQNLQRRVWLLRQVSEELTTRKQNLEETKNIANSLCLPDDDVDHQSKLDKYLSSMHRHSQNTLVPAHPVANSTVVSNNGDINDLEELSWVAKCRGEALWAQLYERRAGLIAALSHDTVAKNTHVGSTPESVLAHTASMHCSLALEAIKNRAYIEQKRKKLVSAISETKCHLTEECELLVLQCERERATARVSTLRTLLQEVTSQQGIFSADGNYGAEGSRSTMKQIVAMDKAIISKRDDLQKMVTSLAVTEKKIQNVRDCLETIFGGFQKETFTLHTERYRGQLDIPQDSITVLRKFYDERREARRNKMQLSLDLDTSENSYSEGLENRTPKFADELKIYLKEFCLEKNRKLVLESGEKIWIFENLQSSLNRLHTRCLEKELSCTFVCPSVSLIRNLEAIVNQVKTRDQFESILNAVQTLTKRNVNIDISLKNQEDEILDGIKKRLNDSILSLQKTNKTLDGGEENLNFWAKNELKKFLSQNRNVDGKSYYDYELFYNETIRLSKA